MTTGWILLFTGAALAIVYAFVSVALEAWARYRARVAIEALAKGYRSKR